MFKKYGRSKMNKKQIRILRDKKIIESLGGCSKLAKRLKVTPQCVWNWKVRGIPFYLKEQHHFLNKINKKKDKP